MGVIHEMQLRALASATPAVSSSSHHLAYAHAEIQVISCLHRLQYICLEEQPPCTVSPRLHIFHPQCSRILRSVAIRSKPHHAHCAMTLSQVYYLYEHRLRGFSHALIIKSFLRIWPFLQTHQDAVGIMAPHFLLYPEPI
jgi:hypothetical protein